MCERISVCEMRPTIRGLAIFGFFLQFLILSPILKTDEKVTVNGRNGTSCKLGADAEVRFGFGESL